MTVTHARSGGPSALSGAEAALARARDHLLGLQHEQGWWQGELETNVTMDAEDLLLREFLGIREAGQTAAAAGWIRAGGGIAATRVFTRIWLALFGEWSWDDLPVMPPEMIYFPAWFPLNVYDFACWARQTIVPLTIVGSLRPVRPLPFGLDELRVASEGEPATGPARPTGWAAAFTRLDKALHAYQRYGQRARPAGAVRRAALRRCAEWILARQERDGCWGGIQPPWVYSLIALHLLGYGLDHPVIKRGLAGLDRFTITEDGPDGPVRRLEACQSPVWDTVLAVVALADAGLPPDHPALDRAGAWLLDEELHGPGDWQVRRPGLSPGGWAFEFDNDGYPDIDDTAEMLLALRRVSLAGLGADPGPGSGPGSDLRPGSDLQPGRRHPAVQRGLRWMAGMQSSGGGWGAFDADNTSALVDRKSTR